MPRGANWSHEQYRAFAKRYVVRRLLENEDDAIEELSAYLGDWLRLQDLVSDGLRAALHETN